MKAKKALKRLDKIEVLLSNVIDQFSASKEGVAELLDSAKAAVVQAKATVNSRNSTTDGKKAPVKAKTGRSRRLTEGRRRTSAAKKRRTVAKRKGMNAVTEPL